MLNVRLLVYPHGGSPVRAYPIPDCKTMQQSSVGKRLQALAIEHIDLLVILAATLLTIPLALFTEGPVRIAFAIPFIIFTPGYCLIAALYPRKDSLDTIERLALSFGTSIAVVPLLGLVLNYTPWGIRLVPILLTVAGFIVVMCGVAGYRRTRLYPEERFNVRLTLPEVGWAGMGRTDRILTVALIASIVFAVGTLIYVVSNPKRGEQFTEFYILGMSGMAEGYPTDFRVGEPEDLIMGIVNHELETVEYTVEARLDGDPAAVRIVAAEGSARQAGPGKFMVGPLADEEKWEQPVQVTALAEGERMKLAFLLFSPRPRDGYHLRALLGEDGYVTIELRESKGQAEVTLQASEPTGHTCRLEAWQNGQRVAQEAVQLAAGEERKVKLSYPPGETIFRVYDGDTLALDDSGAELELHLWVEGRGA